MTRTDPHPTPDPIPDPSSWPPLGTAFVALGVLLVAWAALSPLALVPAGIGGNPADWPTGVALIGGILVLFGLLLGLTEPDRPRRHRGRDRP